MIIKVSTVTLGDIGRDTYIYLSHFSCKGNIFYFPNLWETGSMKSVIETVSNESCKNVHNILWLLFYGYQYHGMVCECPIFLFPEEHQ